ncbi:PepSY domain-containing protein [Nonomuraea sp. NPDC005650]|uniref:PepSY domain-containing protein n=1 Tax=Nonomuraea sp. NPDC005650 TaxID=3157045 RepID=UPI0033B30D10
MQITKKFIAVGAGVVALVAGGGVAFAATTSTTAAPTITVAATGATAAAPKITAERAMEIAHKEVAGAWVSEVDYQTRDRRPDVWEVELTKGAERHEVDVDAATGKVVKHQKDRDDDHGGRDDHGHDDD